MPSPTNKTLIDKQAEAARQESTLRVLAYLGCLFGMVVAFYAATITYDIIFKQDRTPPPISERSPQPIAVGAWEKFLKANQRLMEQLFPNALSALLGAGASVVITTFWLRRDNARSLSLELLTHLQENHLLETILKTQSRVFRQGILDVFKKGPNYLDIFRDQMVHSNGGQIILIDSWLCLDIKEVMERLEEGCLGALKGGCEVILILMHPKSPLLRRRSDFLSKEGLPDIVTKSAREAAGIFEKWAKSCGDANDRSSWSPARVKEVDEALGRMKVYLADVYLSLQVYSLPNVAYTGFYAADVTSTHGPHLSAISGTDIGTMLQRYAQRVLTLCQDKSGRYGVRVKLRETDCFEGVAISEIRGHALISQGEDAQSLFEMLGDRPLDMQGAGSAFDNGLKVTIQALWSRFTESQRKHIRDNLKAINAALKGNRNGR